MGKASKFFVWLARTYFKEMVGKWSVSLGTAMIPVVMVWFESLSLWHIIIYILLVIAIFLTLMLLEKLFELKRTVPQGNSDDTTQTDPVPPEPEPTAPKEPEASSQDPVPAVGDGGTDELPFQAFDTPILEAINYVIDNALHSYTSTGPAQRSAFKSLHGLICDGLLQVIGKETEFGPFREISQSECRGLVPKEVGIPPNEAAPDGVRFSLMHLPDNNQLSFQELQKWVGKTRELQDLHVRSVDLYRHFPKRRSP